MVQRSAVFLDESEFRRYQRAVLESGKTAMEYVGDAVMLAVSSDGQ